MTNTENTTINTYEFSGIRFVPGYNDFDQDWVTIKAQSEEEAWKEFRKLRWIHKGVGISRINGEYQYPTSE
jgi:hypothetical protein